MGGDGNVSDTASGSGSPSDSPSVLALSKRSWQSPDPGGAEVNLEKSLKGLADRGHEVTLLTGSDGSRSRTEQDGGVKICRTQLDQRASGVLATVLAYLGVTLAFHRSVARVQPDIVYTVETPLPWLLLTSRQRVGIFHHVALGTLFETHPPPLAVCGYLAQRLAIRLARGDHTISVSPSTTETLLEYGHDTARVHEIRNGIDVDAFEVGDTAADPHVLYLGNLAAYKGVDRLPAIHRRIEAVYGTPVTLDIAGRQGDEADLVRKYCEQTPSATYHGYVSEQRKHQLLQQAWVLLVPSRIEGWGLAVLEANACGTPAVGMAVDGLTDSIRDGETGLLVGDDCVGEFATAVTTLLSHETRRDGMEREAVKWARQHSWERAGDCLSGLMDDLAAERVSSRSGSPARLGRL